MIKAKPFVTVIMPIRNESTFIAQSLGAVLHQDYPHDKMEIVVADGMSTDNTRDIVMQLAQSHPEIAIKIVDNAAFAVPTGMNAALTIAQGDVVIRVDGHCVIQTDYVTRCVELLDTTEADNVGGIQHAIGRTGIGRAIAKATSTRFGVGGARFHYATKPGWTDTVFLGAYRRSIFNRIGGFDTAMACNEDDEFNFRLLQSGGKIWLTPELKTEYYVRSTWAKFFRQYFRYGFYKVLVIQKRHGVASWRHLIPGLFVLLLCVSLIAGAIMSNLVLTFSVLVSYLLTNIVASIFVANSNWGQIPYLMVAFSVMHISYGIGFLFGLLYWPNKSTDQLEHRLS